MSKTRKASVGVGVAVVLAVIGLTAPSAAAATRQQQGVAEYRQPGNCGYYTDASGTARYSNCIRNAVIVRVEHQNGNPGEDRCIPGYAGENLGPSTEIKWAWAIGGAPGGNC